MDQHIDTRSFRTLAEAAKFLNISIPTAKRWIYSQKLLAHRIGGRWVVPDTELNKFVTYRITRETPIYLANRSLDNEEVRSICDLLASALREVGAPVRADGLLKVVRDEVVPGPLFWRYLRRVLSARITAREKLEASSSDIRHLDQDEGGSVNAAGSQMERERKSLKRSKPGRK